jgi:6-pyruvoyl-tetrahydropterin synthase
MMNAQQAYLTALSPHEQVNHGQILYEYQISTRIKRRHFNPPLWVDIHPHEYAITLHLSAARTESGLFGLDMIEVENALREWAELLPEIVNDCSLCPHGTTEEMCHYFTRLPLAEHITLTAVSIAESPERVTLLRLRKTNF